MWRNIEADSPEVQLLVGVNAGHDEEDPRALGSSRPESSKAEYHSPFIFFHHLIQIKLVIRKNRVARLTFTQKNKERGSSARQRSKEAKTSRTAQQPGPSGSP